MSESKRDHAWSQRITALMEAEGLDAVELSKRMRVARSTAYSWTAGTRIPSRRIQPKLARVLGTSVAALNGWAA